MLQAKPGRGGSKSSNKIHQTWELPRFLSEPCICQVVRSCNVLARYSRNLATILWFIDLKELPSQLLQFSLTRRQACRRRRIVPLRCVADGGGHASLQPVQRSNARKLSLN